MRLLLAENDTAIREYLKRALADIGYQVDIAVMASSAEAMALEGSYDGMIVDLGLPDRNGLDLIRRFREHGCDAPVLILSDRGSFEERVLGLEQGGGDYLTKPFALAELLARLRNLLRRVSHQADRLLLRVGDLQLDLLRRTASRGSRPISLTPLEFALLEYLCSNVGRIVTRTEILNDVWQTCIDP